MGDSWAEGSNIDILFSTVIWESKILLPPFLTVVGGSNYESKVFVSAISKFTEGYLLTVNEG